MSTRPRRWPPGDKAASGSWSGHGLPESDGQIELARAIGDLSGLLPKLLPGKVLGSATYQLSSLGQAAEQYRIPFAALAIASASPAQLTLTADTLKSGPPPSGPGVTIVPPRGFIVANTGGYTWSVYGGNPGDQVTITAFTRPLPPVMIPGQVAIAAQPLTVSQAGDYPAGAVPVDGDSGIQANANAVATLAGTAGKTTWITGFEITSAGATAAAVVTVTLAGPAASKHYVYVTVAGVTLANQPLVVEFTKPVPASAQNTPITVTLPALGAGNTAAAVTAHGYQL